MELSLEPRRLRFRAPIVTAYATYEERELDLVRVTDRDGVTGLGEAAPLEPFDGVSLDAVRAEIEGCRSILAAGDDASPADLRAAVRREREGSRSIRAAGADAPPADLRAACRRACSLPQAVAALDVALWDL